MGYEYSTIAGLAVVTGKGDETSSEVFFGSGLDGHTELGIGEGAFEGDQDIDAVSLDISDFDFIEAAAFKGCVNVEYVSLGDELREIGDSAFEGCGRLKRLTLPEQIESIGSRAFAGCGLDRLELPCGLRYLGPEAFRGCKGLKYVKLPHALLKIADGAFADCPSLEVVDFGCGVQVVGKGAFEGSGLVAAILPDSVCAVEDSAFGSCAKLRVFCFPQHAWVSESATEGCSLAVQRNTSGD